jgi:DNA-binding CsgD family transcriptional regulator/PAS domain-containing protein
VTFDTMDAPGRWTSGMDAEVPEQVVGDPIWSGPAVAEAVNSSAIAVAQVDLATHRVVAVSDAAAALVGLDRAQLVGRLATDFVAGEATGGLPLLATGRLEGFEARRQLRRADGTVVAAYVWAHVLGLTRPARYGAAFLLDGAPAQPPSLWLASPGSDQKVIGTVDGQWRVDRISQEVRPVLGYLAREVAGKQPLTSVNPHDLPQVLAGLAHVHATDRNAVVRLRVRRADSSWLWCRAHLAAMGGAPRFAFTLRPLAAEKIPDGERLSSLESRLARIAQEVRSVAFPVASAAAPVLAEIPELADLTSREWQTLSLFADGARVAGISDTLGLSQSTVRNHLSAIFQKVGVSSQAELLDRLRSPR